MAILTTKIVVDSTGAEGGYKRASLAAQKYSLTSKRAARSSGKTQRNEHRKTEATATKGFSKMKAAAGLTFAFVAMAVKRMLMTASQDMKKFELEMTRSLAIMGDVTEQQRKEMSELAKVTAKSLNIDADEVAKGYFFLASAGLDAAQSLAALPEVAKFAKAGAFDLARATDLSTDALSALGLKSKDAETNLQNLVYVQDNLVKANTLANATVEQFSLALTTKAANAMRLLNISLEEGLGLLAVWADQGVKGEMAGTRMEITLRELEKAWRLNKSVMQAANVEVFDSEGNFASLADITEQLSGRLAQLTPEMQSVELANMGFTARSISAIKSLIGQSDAIREYTAAQKESAGITDEVANKQMKALDERIGMMTQRFKIMAMEGVRPAIESLAMFADWIVKVTRNAGGLADSIEKNINHLGDLGRADQALQTMEELYFSSRDTADEQERWNDALKTLAEQFPEYISNLDDAGNAIDFYHKGLKIAIDLERTRAMRQLGEDSGELIGGLSRNRTNLASIQDIREKMDKGQWNPIGSPMAGVSSYSRENIAEAESNLRMKIMEAEVALTRVFLEASRSGDKSLITQFFREAGVSAEQALEITKEFEKKVADMKGAQMSKAIQEILDRKPAVDPSSEYVTLKEEYDFLKQRQTELVSIGIYTEEIEKINRRIVEIDRTKNELLAAGTEEMLRQIAHAERLVKLAQEEKANLLIETMYGTGGVFAGWNLTDKESIRRGGMASSARDNRRQKGIDVARNFQFSGIGTGGRSEADKKIEKEITSTLKNMAAAGRAIMDVADAFGNLSDELRGAVNGALNILDNVGSLKDLGEGAGVIDKIIPYAGIAAGVLGVVGGLFGGGDDGPTDEEVKEAIKENTRRLENAIGELLEQARPAENIDGNLGLLLAASQADVVNSINTLNTTESQDLNELEAMQADALSSLNQWRELMRDTGIDEGVLDSLYEELRIGIGTAVTETGLVWNPATGEDEYTYEVGLSPSAMLYLQNLENITTPLTDQGQYSNSNYRGVLGLGQFQSEFSTTMTPEDIYNEVLASLSSLDFGNSDISDTLSQARGEDVTTQAGRDNIAAIIGVAMEEIQNGDFDFGSLTPADVDEIFRSILGFANAGDLGGESGIDADGNNVSYQVQRQITVFQANEMIVLDEERNYILKGMRSLLETMAGVSSPTGNGSYTDMGFEPFYRSPLADINVTVVPEITQTTFDQITTELENSIRERIDITA